MPIPLATTTITVYNPTAGSLLTEPYEGKATQVAASGVRAVIDTPTSGAHGGQDKRAGGEQTSTTLRLFCDPCPLERRSIVVDAAKPDLRYRVVWLHAYTNTELGDDHIQAEIEVVEGAV